MFVSVQTVSDPSRDSRRVGVAELSDLQPDGPVCRHQEAVGRTARKLPPQPPPSCSSASDDPLVPSSKQVQSVRLNITEETRKQARLFEPLIIHQVRIVSITGFYVKIWKTQKCYYRKPGRLKGP